VSPFPTRRVFTLRQRERSRAFTLLSNFRSPVSGLRSPVSKFSTSNFVISNLSAKAQRAFTLLELLVVIGIIAILMVLIAPAFTSIKTGNDVTSAAYTIKGVLDQARTYAKANNTYTWVGFYEENTTATAPTNSAPPYPGKGRLLMATVYSVDGTVLAPAGTQQLGKLTRIEGAHLTDIGNPSPTPNPTPAPDTLGARSATPYTDGSPSDHYNRISSDSSDTTDFSFTVQNYTFYKTVRFGPGGEANLNYSSSPYLLRHVGEIGMQQTQGPFVDTNSQDVVAFQLCGVDGSVKIYRR
jgi:prepilin-type N-terminal cleavage/methylation domain-containing protein